MLSREAKAMIPFQVSYVPSSESLDPRRLNPHRRTGGDSAKPGGDSLLYDTLRQVNLTV